MYKPVSLLLFAAIGYLSGPPARTTDTRPSAYWTLVLAERNFAEFTGKHGIKAGFTRYLADEALVVVRGRYQLGKPLYEKMADQPSVLSWWPVYADIAASGDFGYTTGPFEVRPQATTDAPVAFGQFTSVWRKTSTGEWKVLADVGITHPAPNQPAAATLHEPSVTRKKFLAATDTATSQKELLGLEADIAQVAGSRSLGAAYRQVLAPTEAVRLYRTGSQPYVGPTAIPFAASQTARATYTSVKAVAAASNDLGFTYGYAQYQQQSGPFLRIWRRDANCVWKLVHEVMDLH
ncbi:nuclear transport factor 2 family protein [Hymenobacter volaticus]|uniref:Nuclear transport factor 2 family protein n=1 Tax=Hymenobacter volaticus TaxID=2932254 RepID=A0ABY4G9N2_9BACT|nr:nuclear transport factor 2 family protein [Hymenobacter volaticus]UOQ67604.1 nuclear transport factor 2 family protein [Hymenobacter volaticus]